MVTWFRSFVFNDTVKNMLTSMTMISPCFHTFEQVWRCGKIKCGCYLFEHYIQTWGSTINKRWIIYIQLFIICANLSLILVILCLFFLVISRGRTHMYMFKYALLIYLFVWEVQMYHTVCKKKTNQAILFPKRFI